MCAIIKCLNSIVSMEKKENHMKKTNSLLATLGVACLISGAALANDEQMVETYAHPTMFGSAAQQTVSADGSYVVGGKIVKAANKIGITGKKNVAVKTFANDVLATIKNNTSEELWDAKLPILRSELAVVLAEGLNLQDTVAVPYTDITEDYWATQWISKALASRVMIGYPDKTFKPDQKVTKAEVFATLATLMSVPNDATATPTFKNSEVQYIPTWAVAASNEVIASQVLENVPCPKKVINDEYLSREQVAYLVGSLRTAFANASISYDSALGSYTPTSIRVKLTERLSAKTSNIGDKFIAKTTENVSVNGTTFPVNSKVYGEIIEVARPGVHNPGYLRVKFNKIVNGDITAEFPTTLTEAEATKIKNPNFIARLLGAPLSTAARITGVAGRSVSQTGNIVSDGLEQYGDNLSNTLVNTASLQPVAGVRSFGGSFITLGKGVYNIVKTAVSGTFGLVYEVADEIVYLVYPAASNDSSLNPGEELVIVY